MARVVSPGPRSVFQRLAHGVAPACARLDSTRPAALHRCMPPSWLEWLLQTRRAGRPPERPGTRLWDVGGAVLRVRTAGERGPTLVIVPDPPNVIEHYDRLIELLVPDVRVVC